MLEKWNALHVVIRGVIITVTGLAVLAIVAPLFEDDSQDDPAVGPSYSTVTYELSGSVSYADVTVLTPTGIEQLTPDVPLVTKTGETGLVYRFRVGAPVSISAQKKDASGSLTCRILVDGRQVSMNTSTAAYGIASCRGQA